MQLQYEGIDKTINILQLERSKRLESNIEPILHMIAHCSRDADAARWTFGLEPCRHIHDIAVDVSAIWNCIAYIDAHTEANRTIGRTITIVGRYLLLHLDRTSHRSVYAI